ESRIAVCMGGRIAEDLTFGQISTGAQNDIEQATEMARKMVCEWGMSDRMGPLTFGKSEEHIFLGREMSRPKDYSEDTAILIDTEIKRIVNDAAVRARRLLETNLEKLHALASALLERESLDGEEIARILRARPFQEAPAPA
ncbi:MAG TPA: cell division protein FtsH, partial [Candidatus Limnocylindrales bacterium]|nr:cell division protein FtsH [Candidatus Limnocylindrales bacterium]